jgi:FMN-dependent NADH-azoreductase
MKETEINKRKLPLIRNLLEEGTQHPAQQKENDKPQRKVNYFISLQKLFLKNAVVVAMVVFPYFPEQQ